MYIYIPIILYFNVILCSYCVYYILYYNKTNVLILNENYANVSVCAIAHTDVCICMYVCMHVCKYVCMYVCMCVFYSLYTYIHTYIHT